MPASYIVEIDFDGDGAFGHAASDVSDDFKAPIRANRGRQYGGQIIGRTIAGEAEITLRNDTNRYDRFDPASPVFGLLAPRRLIRLRMRPTAGATPVSLWTGWIDQVEQITRRGGDHEVKIKALGVLSALSAMISVPLQQGIGTPAAARLVLEAGGLADAYIGQLNGDEMLRRWWVREQVALDALREIEETESGFVFENADGQIDMVAQTGRRAAATPSNIVLNTTAAADWPALEARRDDPLQDIANHIRVTAREYGVGATQGVWQLPAPIGLGPNETITMTAPYPTADSPPEHVGVANWLPLVAGVNYPNIPSLTITTTTTATEMVLTLTNTSSTIRIDVPFLIVTAQPLQVTGEVIVEREHAASIADFGRRTYMTPSRFFTDLLDAEQYAFERLRDRRAPNPKVRVTVEADDDPTTAASLDLGTIVTLRQAMGDTQMIVEAIHHRIDRGLRHFVTLTLTEALPAGGRFTLDHPTLGRLDSGNRLGA